MLSGGLATNKKAGALTAPAMVSQGLENVGRLASVDLFLGVVVL